MSLDNAIPSDSSGDGTASEHEVFAFGPFKLFPAKRLLEKSGQPVKLGGRAFDILVLLVQHVSEVVPQRQIHAVVWAGLIVDEGSLRFHISALRKALGEGQSDVQYIVNVPGRGYCFVAPVTHLRTVMPVLRASVHVDEGVPNSIPPALARMVGRNETVHDIGIKLLADRFVTIVGPGGMGKTTVAVALSHATRSEFAGAVKFVDLSNIQQQYQVGAAIAVAIGVRVRSDDSVPSILDALRDRHLLLVIDSCEHVLDAVGPIVEKIFSHARDVYVLATSREPLGVEGEHVFKLPPLRMPPEAATISAKELIEYSAPELFLERATAGGSQIELDDENVELVVYVCRRLDGIALAIELAAGRVQTYGLHKTAQLLGQQFSLIWPGRRTALPRHQTLQATLDWSYNLLSPTERRLLCRISIFIGTFDLEAVRSIAWNGLRNLDQGYGTEISSLVSKSLAITEMRSGGETRFRLLDTTRNYGLQKLGESGELQDIAQLHALYFEKLLSHHAAIERQTGEWPKGLASSLNDIRAAMNWSLSNDGDRKIAIRLAAYSASLWLGLGLLPECRVRMLRALENGDQIAAMSEEEILIQMALGAAVMFTAGLGEEFRISWGKVLSLAEELGDLSRQLTAYLTLWAQQIRAFKLAEASSLARRCAEVAAESSSTGSKSMARWMLGLCEHHMGRYESAKEHLEEALISEDEVDRYLQIRRFGYDRRTDGLAVLSNVLLMQGNAADALETSATAVSEARHLDSPIPLCVALAWHCFNLHVVGAEWSEVEQQSKSLAEYAQRHGIVAYQGIGLCLQALSGKPDVAAEEIATTVANGLKMLESGQYNAFDPIFMAETAMALAAAGHLTNAATLFATMERGDRNPDHWCKPEIFRIKGEIELHCGRFEEAERLFQMSMELAVQHGSLTWNLRSASSLASLWTSQGRQEQAAGLLQPLLIRFQSGVISGDLQKARLLLKSMEQSPLTDWPTGQPVGN